MKTLPCNSAKFSLWSEKTYHDKIKIAVNSLPRQTRLQVQPIHILANDELNNIGFHHANQCHMCNGGLRRFKCHIGFRFLSLLLKCPYAFWTTKIWNASTCANSCSSMHNNALCLQNHGTQYVKLFMYFVEGVKLLHEKEKYRPFNSCHVTSLYW